MQADEKKHGLCIKNINDAKQEWHSNDFINSMNRADPFRAPDPYLYYLCKGIERGHRVSPAGLPIEQFLGEYSLS